MKLFKPRKNSLRLKNWSYNSVGFYFVTMIIQDRRHLLGEIKNGEMILSEYGKIAFDTWANIPKHYDNVDIDEYVIMPDHMHGIIVIQKDPRDKGEIDIAQGQASPIASHIASPIALREEHCSSQSYESSRQDIHPAQSTEKSHVYRYAEQYGLVSKIVKSFKEVTVKTIKREYKDHDFKWQRNYHDSIIRSEESLERVRKYIIQNPLKWDLKDKKELKK